MRIPFPQFSNSLILALVIGVAGGPVALAASQDQATPHEERKSADKPVAAPMTGQQVYSNVCIACHSPPGIGGAPALGDNAAWAARLTQGMDTLIEHALHGFTGTTGVMPKKGERLDLSDEEVIRAVEYMVEQATR